MLVKDWNNNLQELRSIILKPDMIAESKKLCLELHQMVHLSEVSDSKYKTFEDELWEGLDEQTMRLATNKKGRTIVYGIWHSTRIEDITMNLLVCGHKQVFESGNWHPLIQSPIRHTGNSLSTEGIAGFSQVVNIEELKKYRISVGQKTREIIKSLEQGNFNQKVIKDNLGRILSEGAVDNVASANWLIDFWGNKNIAGIILMPALRHNLVHINESLEAKRKGKI